MPKEDSKPIDNGPLIGMLFTGGTFALIGAIVWLTATDFGYDPNALRPGTDETDPQTQFIGAAMALAGTILVSLGWAAAAICRFLANRD